MLSQRARHDRKTRQTTCRGVSFAEDTPRHCKGISMCLEHVSRRLKVFGVTCKLAHADVLRFRFRFSSTVSMCLERVSWRLKDSQVLRRAHRNPFRTTSNSKSSKPLAHIGVGIICTFATANALRFHFHFFSRTVPFSPRSNVGKWISYFSETVLLPTRCMRVHLHCVCVCVRAWVRILILFGGRNAND